MLMTRITAAATPLVLWIGLALGGEAPEPPKAEPLKTESAKPEPAESAVPKMDAKVKAQRIDRATKTIADYEGMLPNLTPEKIAAAKERDARTGSTSAASKEKTLTKITAALPKLRVEIRWLKGDLTLAGTEAAVAAAQEALAKAEKDKSPQEAPKAALETATFERDEVRRLEEAEKPKEKEPEA